MLARTALALLVVSSLALVGCGHPASRAECEQILDKVVELELASQNIKDPTLVAQRKEDTRKAKGDALMNRCVGRKITDKALACVRTATSYDQINDVCLR